MVQRAGAVVAGVAGGSKVPSTWMVPFGPCARAGAVVAGVAGGSKVPSTWMVPFGP